jgi:hypothetical protein
MSSFITKPFSGLNNWTKRLRGRKVHTNELAFSSTVRHLENTNWTNGMREQRTVIFGQGKNPFETVLKQHEAKEGDIVILDAHSGESPRSSIGPKKAVGNNYEKGTIKVYTPDGALKTKLLFSHDQDHLKVTKYAPAGSWIWKKNSASTLENNFLYFSFQSFLNNATLKP